MSRLWAERLAGWIAWNREEIDKTIRAADPALFGIRPARSAPSLAFHAWHIGRWVDRNLVALSAGLEPGGPREEVWVRDDVAARWGLDRLPLGDYGGSGAGLDDEASAALPLPGVDDVLDYVGAAYRALEALLATLDDQALERRIVDPYGDEEVVSEILLNHLSHADRHLGMIEAVRGVLGERGTATV